MNNKIILRGKFKAKIVDGNIELFFDDDCDRIYIDSDILYNEISNIQFLENENNKIIDIIVETAYN